MITKDEIESIKELTKLQKQEIEYVVNADMPIVLKKVSDGLTLKEMKYFKEKRIVDLRARKNKEGEEIPLSNEEVIFDIVVPLLELRGVDAESLDDVHGSSYLTYYKKVEALTNNPTLQEEVKKKS